MPYQAELDFLQKVFSKCNLQLLFLDSSTPQNSSIDLGLRKMLGLESLYEYEFYNVFRTVQVNTIYRLTDLFFCSYIFFLLPGRTESNLAIIGPYLSVELTHEQLLETAERYNIPAAGLKLFEKYFSGIPTLLRDNPIFQALDVFAEHIWGGSDMFASVDVNQEAAPGDITPLLSWEYQEQPEQSAWNIQALEIRYARENELIQAVSKGQAHKAELLMAGFSQLAFERRLADPVRNIKNYCIIMNTLLRKAAENGGVHPLYLDRQSSEFAHRIEALSSTAAAQTLIRDIFHGYCRLVKQHSTQHHSPPVQKAILYIQSNLSSDLSLKALSLSQNINASYLSSLFKKETGHTVTDYVNQSKIEHAMWLLRTTKLQIQTVAQHCGIPDVNYFSKIFKKYTQLSPKDFRKVDSLRSVPK